MKERPILFSGEMVRAILDGRKTQTRRVCSPKLQEKFANYREYWHGKDNDCFSIAFGGYHGGGGERITRAMLAERFCPYGAPAVESRPNDRLWVRETWLELEPDMRHDAYKGKYEITGIGGRRAVNCVSYRADCDRESDRIRAEYGYKWRPSIYMPRWASRITLEIKSVRVERLCEITDRDAQAEGVDDQPLATQLVAPGTPNYRQAFAELWDSINGKNPDRSWSDNPWVWVIEFSRVS